VEVPRIVRPMYADSDGLPKIGSNRRSLLGVRSHGPNADIDSDELGNVVRNRKGLSVTADWRKLPGHLIPQELDDGFNGASGKGMKVYVHGRGDFAEGAVADGLEMLFKTGRGDSGILCPTASVPSNRFQADIAATRNDWVEDPS